MDKSTEELAQATIYAYCALVDRLRELGLTRQPLVEQLAVYADCTQNDNVARFLVEFAEAVAKGAPSRTVH